MKRIAQFAAALILIFVVGQFSLGGLQTPLSPQTAAAFPCNGVEVPTEADCVRTTTAVCYTTGSSGTIARTTCPTDQRTEDGKCYVFASSSQGVGNLREEDCVTLDRRAQGLTAEQAEGIERQEDIAERCAQYEETPDVERPAECGKLVEYINAAINFLSAGVGILVTIMIIIASIQFITSGGDPNKAQHAKERIRNSVIALIAYIFLAAFINYLVPGGIIQNGPF
jgi:hypothetical protein